MKSFKSLVGAVAVAGLVAIGGASAFAQVPGGNSSPFDFTQNVGGGISVGVGTGGTSAGSQGIGSPAGQGFDAPHVTGGIQISW